MIQKGWTWKNRVIRSGFGIYKFLGVRE